MAAPRHAAFIHGESGLDGPTLPPLTRRPADGTAVRFLLESAEARDDLWLVATGPLTNVALALGEEPGLAQRLRGISLMGGSYGTGNVTPTAEFNILADPEAAAVVFGSGARLVMAGLDLTHRFRMNPTRVAAVRALGNRAATFAAELLDAYGAAYARSFGPEVGVPLHDPCAVLALTHPALFASEERHVQVELAGTLTRGMTVVDRRRGARGEAPNTTVLTDLDDEGAFEVMRAALGRYA